MYSLQTNVFYFILFVETFGMCSSLNDSKKGFPGSAGDAGDDRERIRRV